MQFREFVILCLRISLVSAIYEFHMDGEGPGFFDRESKEPIILGNFTKFCPGGEEGPFCVPADYLAFLPPKYNLSDERLVVNISFYVRELSSIDSFNKDFTLLISINMAWEDNRVQWKDDFTTPEGHELILNIKDLE